jgi:hypothetical protein
MPISYRLTPTDYRNTIKKLGLATSVSQSSTNVMVHCPFHGKQGDKHSSLSIHTRSGACQCFQCHWNGHISELVLRMSNDQTNIYQLLGIDTKDSELDGWLGISKYEEPIVDPKKIMNEVTINVRGGLYEWAECGAAIEYLKIRSITPYQANRANIQYTDEAIINEMYFNNRLCIPIYDDAGKLINIEGRDVTFKQSKKCIYPKNTIKPLYEWYKLDYNQPVYLFEGLIKMLVARSDDYFANSSTNFGSYFSELQALQLKLFKHIIIVPDNDNPGLEFIKQIRANADPKAIIEILRIINPYIKDADEIPSKSGMSVRDFRLSGGFMLELSFL